jgi:hypothetical protein
LDRASVFETVGYWFDSNKVLHYQGAPGLEPKGPRLGDQGKAYYYKVSRIGQFFFRPFQVDPENAALRTKPLTTPPADNPDNDKDGKQPRITL